MALPFDMVKVRKEFAKFLAAHNIRKAIASMCELNWTQLTEEWIWHRVSTHALLRTTSIVGYGEHLAQTRTHSKHNIFSLNETKDFNWKFNDDGICIFTPANAIPTLKMCERGWMMEYFLQYIDNILTTIYCHKIIADHSLLHARQRTHTQSSGQLTHRPTEKNIFVQRTWKIHLKIVHCNPLSARWVQLRVHCARNQMNIVLIIEIIANDLVFACCCRPFGCDAERMEYRKIHTHRDVSVRSWADNFNWRSCFSSALISA